MYLSDNKIQYVFFHLWQHLSKETFGADPFLVIKEGEKISEDVTNKIIFVLSESEKPDPVNLLFKDQEIPVLFGNDYRSGPFYREDKNGNLWFLPDFLSSVFWLLSGMQEVIVSQRDRYGRFPFESSIQKQLECAHLPVVNYYFEMIIEGLEVYGQKHNVKKARKRLFNNFGFVLSHDVDRISFFHPFRVLYKIRQLLGLASLNYSRGKTASLFFKGIFFNLNPFRKMDPWWNFDWMIDLEKRLGIRSAFLFLKQEDRFDNSLYKFHFKKIKGLIKKLKEDGFEIGLHGTMRSAADKDNLLKQKDDLTKALGEEPVGIRQHYLRFFHPKTFKVQQSAGLVYDTSLGFAEHDGYRNGYCYPFHPYDFEADEMMKIWEIPLVMMEVSVLQYRKEGFEALRSSVFHYISEAVKFGGIFSLLWHNCRLSEYEYEGVTEFYEGLLEEIVEENAEVVTGRDLILKKVRIEQ
jgi:peptidoglycan/xylan/chitin deacetylase (PgdA/CDA1 family)